MSLKQSSEKILSPESSCPHVLKREMEVSEESKSASVLENTPHFKLEKD